MSPISFGDIFYLGVLTNGQKGITIMTSLNTKLVFIIFLDSSMVEHSAVNRVVVGSSPTRGAKNKWHALAHEFFITAPWSSG